MYAEIFLAKAATNAEPAVKVVDESGKVKIVCKKFDIVSCHFGPEAGDYETVEDGADPFECINTWVGAILVETPLIIGRLTNGECVVIAEAC